MKLLLFLISILSINFAYPGERSGNGTDLLTIETRQIFTAENITIYSCAGLDRLSDKHLSYVCHDVYENSDNEELAEFFNYCCVPYISK